jgi:hypothetical protein
MAVLACAFTAQAAAAAVPNPGHEKLGARHELRGGGASGGRAVTKNFRLLGHHDLGGGGGNGDVWSHGNFAYVGSFREPCDGSGVKILDVSNLRNPQLIGALAAREGTSGEDVVVRRVSTPFFSGDLAGVGIQRCDFDNPELDDQEFGLQLWNVTNPYAPVFLTEFGVGHGEGGVHELDLFQRGGKVYALLAHPFGEWFSPSGDGDFMIVDITNPSFPVLIADWGAGENGFARGPFWGQGDFGAMYGHSARASADGTKAYVSYWDLGVLTFDISDPANPVLLTRTTYEDWEDGDAHSMTPYRNERGKKLILQNDEDLAVMTPADIDYGSRRHGLGNEGFVSPPLWAEPGHKLAAPVVMAANQGCEVSDYPVGTAGKIAVAYTPFPFLDPSGDEPLCAHHDQEVAAEAAGAVAVVHDFVAENTSPQWFDFGPIGIHVFFTDHETAQGMVAAGWARIKARKPSWGYLRVYDAKTGRQVAQFDDAPNVHRSPAPEGFWSIHNTEVLGDRAYSSWYSNGIVALDLGPLDKKKPRDPRMVGQFVPPPSGAELSFFGMWGVYVRADGIVFGSDIGSGLWIVKPKGRAAS